MLRPEDVPEVEGWRSDWLTERVRGVLPRYLWIVDEDRHRCLVCDSCREFRHEYKKKSRWETKYKQNESVTCPMCGASVIAKHTGKGYSTLVDDLEIVFYRRGTDDQTIIAYGAYCRREFSWADGEPWNVDPDINLRSVCVIRYGRGGNRYTVKKLWDGMTVIGSELLPVQGCDHLAFNYAKPLLGIGRNAVQRIGFTDTLMEAVAGTPFARAWDEYYLDRADCNYKDQIRVLDMIAKYPAMEYLNKNGYHDIVVGLMNRTIPRTHISLRAKSKEKVLKLSAQQLGDLKAAGIRLTAEMHNLYYLCNRRGIRIAPEDAALIAEGSRVFDTLERGLERMPKPIRQRAIKYIARQIRAGVNYYDILDYWEDCRRMESNMGDDRVSLPKNLNEAHRRTTERIRHKANAALDEKIRMRYDELEKRYGFSWGGITLRPARDSSEVIREGETLGHCVGGYVARYANGGTVICVLRRDVEPDAPWRTVEIATDGHMVQDRGYRNDIAQGFGYTLDYQKMLGMFWAEWKKREAA